MTVRDASKDAYHSLDLTAKQRAVMLKCHECFTGIQFTRKDLAEALGWPINCVTGRVLELVDKKFLTELPAKREGSHLLQINTTSEGYRHECEVRVVADMATNQERADYLQGVTKKRGEAAAERLRRDAWEIMKAVTA